MLKIALWGLMSLGLTATACAIVRATNLTMRVTDMSYEYCITSTWASTELNLGIIATNLSLSRSIYRFFFTHAGNLLVGSSNDTANESTVCYDHCQLPRRLSRESAAELGFRNAGTDCEFVKKEAVVNMKEI